MKPLVETLNAVPLTQFIALYFNSLQPFFLSKDAHSLTLHDPSTIPPLLLKSCLDLLTHTSFSDYASSSQGWSASKKERELKLPDLRYLLLTAVEGNTDEVEAFVSFMPTYEDGEEVLYVYELHVVEDLRQQGLGGRLMDIVEDAGRKMGLRKVMLTVFTSNQAARKFYLRRGYHVDAFSPSPRKFRDGSLKEADYVILSKTLNT